MPALVASACAQARADEIVSAWDAWQDAKRDNAEALGAYDLEDRSSEALEARRETFRVPMAAPATLAG